MHNYVYLKSQRCSNILIFTSIRQSSALSWLRKHLVKKHESAVHLQYVNAHRWLFVCPIALAGLIFDLCSCVCRERSSKSKAGSKAESDDKNDVQPPTPTTPEVVSVLPEEKRNEYKKLKLQLAIKEQRKEANKKDGGSLENMATKQTQEKTKVAKHHIQKATQVQDEHQQNLSQQQQQKLQQQQQQQQQQNRRQQQQQKQQQQQQNRRQQEQPQQKQQQHQKEGKFYFKI